jgi:hypothetical protein
MGWLGWTAGVVAVLGLCCLLVGTTALFVPSARQFFRVNGLDLPGNGWNPEPTETAEQLSLVPSPENTPIIWPEVTAAASETPTLEPAVPTVEPTPIESTATEAIPSQTSVPTRVAQVFQDDFSDLSTGWLQLDDEVRMVGYHEGAMYGMALLQPGSDANILIPHGFDLPLSEVSLYFRARPVEGKGYFGVMCNYVDSQNYLLMGITEGGYMVANKESGQFRSFFDSLWIQDPYVASEDGEFQVLAVCGSDKIQLMVNGYSLPEVSNLGFAGGDVFITAHADQDAVTEGEFFYKVLFDDLELNVK